MFKGSRVDKIYLLDLDDVSLYGTKYLITKNEDSCLWHMRLGHAHLNLINKVASKNLVIDL